MASQGNIEEVILSHYQKGTFLEIGCWDGELISQTFELEKKGWKGLCVDPLPKNFENRKAKLCEMAISKDGKEREFVKVTIDRRYGGDVSYFSGFVENIAAHWELISEHCDYTIEKVNTITFDKLYSKYKLPLFIEFLSVDTEGSELEIFQSIDFSKYKFGIIMFEHNNDTKSKYGVGRILKANGYKLLHEMVIDDIYVC